MSDVALEKLQMKEKKITVEKGMISAPTAPGLGLTPNWDFVHEFKQKINH